MTGAGTTGIATIGLGNKIGNTVFGWAIFSRRCMAWFYRSFFPRFSALGLSFAYRGKRPVVCGCHCFYIYSVWVLYGNKFVGGVFFSTEMLLIILITGKPNAKALPVGPYKLPPLFGRVVDIIVGGGRVYSVVKLFVNSNPDQVLGIFIN